MAAGARTRARLDALRAHMDERKSAIIGSVPLRLYPMRRYLLFVLSVLSFLALPLAGPSGGLAAQQLQQLEIVSKNGTHVFGVEMAVTPEEQSKGLMFRRELPDRQGMLFDFKREQPTNFWMKNTYIPLDMIFIRADGRILNIAENTVPLSEALVSSAGPVRAVLEVIAGTTKKLGIAAGDRVVHPIFGGR